MNIDWSKAPEWATGHAVIGFSLNAVWFNSERYQYVYGGGRFDFENKSALTYCFDDLSNIIERPKKQDAWDGEGLPPVGTICEVLWNESRMEYLITKVFGVNEHGQPIHRFDEGPKKYQYQTDVLRTTSGTQVFRPIKTAEQLEEEEKKQEIDEMQRIYEESMLDYSSRLGHASRPAIKALYEAGYRKQ